MKSKHPALFSDYTVPPALPGAREACLRNAVALQRQGVPRMGLKTQMRTQLGYTGVWLWLGTAAVLAVLLAALLGGSRFAPQDRRTFTLLVFGTAGPLLAALSAPVLAKSHTHGMWELEESAFHNLPRLTALRLLLTLLAALPALAVLGVVGLGATGALPGLCALAAPFLLACALNYAILGRLRGTAGSLCCVGACLGLALLVFGLFVGPEPLLFRLQRQGPPLLLLLLACAVLLFALGAARLVRKSSLERNAYANYI